MIYNETPLTKIIQQRYSCRHYKAQPIPGDQRAQLRDFIQALPPGPFGSQPRFDLVAATEDDRKALRGLGTYGFIKNAPAFIIGAAVPTDYHLEDYGYRLEQIILHATSLGLGTCWLGGTFTKSRFAELIKLRENEEMPAVVSIGQIENTRQKRRGLISNLAGSYKRLPWEKLFFNFTVGVPLLANEAGEYATPLEMVRIAPSASNKQPWRVISGNEAWHFYLQRTPGYRDSFLNRLLNLCDLQRVDMGIAMCHFELAAQSLGLAGQWDIKPERQDTHPLGEYLVSWQMAA